MGIQARSADWAMLRALTSGNCRWRAVARRRRVGADTLSDYGSASNGIQPRPANWARRAGVHCIRIGSNHGPRVLLLLSGEIW